MSNALLAGVSGLQAHQKMLDVAGNNLANLNTNAYKASRTTFSELLSETLADSSQPTSDTGGTNPMQIGSGVQVASVDRDMSQGPLVNTGQPLDMAIGQKDVFTRVGAFTVDGEYYLVDPGNGYRVQRIGSEGVSEGFQVATSDAIRIPYEVALPAKVTTEISFSGNLSADVANPTTNVLSAGQAWTLASGAVASDTTALADVTGAVLAAGDKIHIRGIKADGSYVNGAAAGVEWTLAGGETISDLITQINTAFDSGTSTGATAALVNGGIRVTDNSSGYSQTMLELVYEADAGNPNGAFPLPNYFGVLTAGGEESRNINLEAIDGQGIGHVLSGAFVRRDTANVWDFVLMSITGDVQLSDRRVNGIKFLADGSYGGLTAVTGPDGNPMTDTAQIKLSYPNDPTNTVTIDMSLGTIGGFDGLSQFGGSSTVAPSGQNGYTSGLLSSISVNREGVLVGVFTNGIRRDVAALKIASFRNPAGLKSVGNNYFEPSTNSGDPIPTKALSGSAGSIRGGALEKSNVDVAVEFVNLMQAQNGFQANARTIRVANEMLSDLTNLLR